MRNIAKPRPAKQAPEAVAEAPEAVTVAEAPAMPEAAPEAVAEAVAPEAPEAEAPAESPAPEAEAAPEAPNKAALYAEARNVFSAFDGAASLPIKPLATFKAYRPALGVLKPGMRPSPRQAATLCVAVLASGQRFNAAPDAEAVTFPRRFTLAGSDYATENGATADCVSAGLAAYDAEAEAFTVTAKQAAQIRGLLGKRAAPAFA